MSQMCFFFHLNAQHSIYIQSYNQGCKSQYVYISCLSLGVKRTDIQIQFSLTQNMFFQYTLMVPSFKQYEITLKELSQPRWCSSVVEYQLRHQKVNGLVSGQGTCPGAGSILSRRCAGGSLSMFLSHQWFYISPPSSLSKNLQKYIFLKRVNSFILTHYIKTTFKSVKCTFWKQSTI